MAAFAEIKKQGRMDVLQKSLKRLVDEGHFVINQTPEKFEQLLKERFVNLEHAQDIKGFLQGLINILPALTPEQKEIHLSGNDIARNEQLAQNCVSVPRSNQWVPGSVAIAQMAGRPIQIMTCAGSDAKWHQRLYEETHIKINIPDSERVKTFTELKASLGSSLDEKGRNAVIAAMNDEISVLFIALPAPEGVLAYNNQGDAYYGLAGVGEKEALLYNNSKVQGGFHTNDCWAAVGQGADKSPGIFKMYQFMSLPGNSNMYITSSAWTNERIVKGLFQHALYVVHPEDAEELKAAFDKYYGKRGNFSKELEAIFQKITQRGAVQYAPNVNAYTGSWGFVSGCMKTVVW